MPIMSLPGVRPLLGGLVQIFRPYKRAETDQPLTPAAAREALQSGVFNADDSPTGALALPAVAACEAAITETVAQLPLAVYRRDGDAKVKATDHPVFRLLHDRPNEYQTPFIFWRLAVQLAIRRGDAFLFIERDASGQPANLLPLDNSKVKVCFGPDPNNATAGSTKFFRYEDKYRIEAADMVHLLGKSNDGIAGVPLLQNHTNSVALGLAAESYGIRFFLKGTATGGTLEFPGTLTDVQFKQIRESWEEAHGGLEKMHKVPVIPYGGKFNPGNTSNRDGEFMELRKFQKLEICSVFNVPPSVVGHLDAGGLTYNNVESAKIDFLVHTIKPWADRIAQELTVKLLGTGGEYFTEHNFDDLLMADTVTRTTAYEKGFGKWLTTNDIRRKENLPDIAGGDEMPASGTTPPTPTAPPASNDPTPAAA